MLLTGQYSDFSADCSPTLTLPHRGREHIDGLPRFIHYSHPPKASYCVAPLRRTTAGGVLKCMLVNDGQTKSNGDTVYLRCGSSKYHLLSPLPWAEYKAKRQIRQ